MGNILNLCRSKKVRMMEMEDAETRTLESQIYLPGSLEYLAKVGLDKRGKIIDKKSMLLRLDHL